MTDTLCVTLETLVRRTRSDAAVLQSVFESHGIEPDEAVRSAATDEFRRAVSAFGADPYRQSMRAAVEASESEADPDDLVETLREETYAATTVPEAAPESLAGLAADNRLAVVADGPRDWQVGKLDHHGLGGRFDAVVTSYDVGAHLPAAALFERVRERLPAETHVAVGDEDDLAEARSAGFVPIHYERDGPDLWATVEALL